jgi:hypothetical protein
MEQRWFEMPEIRRRKYRNAVWIPLRVNQVLLRNGKPGSAGFQEEYFGAGSLAIPTEMKEATQQLGWMEIGVVHEHSAYVQDGHYHASDRYEQEDSKLIGIPLVIEQRLTRNEPLVWHLHQDLIVALGLLREGDAWVCPREGYLEVARLRRDGDGEPEILEIRAEFLGDYLCAREMALRISSYRSRRCITDDASHITWQENPICEETPDERWEAGVGEISEGGMPYGSESAYLRVGRTDVYADDDVPVLDFPTDEDTQSESFRIRHTGKKLFNIQGECWRTEWVDSGGSSPRVRGDEVEVTVQFITDAKGTRETKATLVQGSRWLWIQPDVIMALSHRRGGHLGWYTRETGNVSGSPEGGVHFGVNPLGLVNVYAKDIALLPEWQQRIWAGSNVSPDGGVCDELLASQMRCCPASTKAPEERFAVAMTALDEAFRLWKGAALFREHEERAAILSRVHRFRAVDRNGLFSLAKDMARLIADSIDVAELQKVVAPPKKEKWGSLKSLEKVLASISAPDEAHGLMTPLVGVYELRLGDAHLPGSKLDEALEMVSIHKDMPSVLQGACLIENCAIALESIQSKLMAAAQANTPKGKE